MSVIPLSDTVYSMNSEKRKLLFFILFPLIASISIVVSVVINQNSSIGDTRSAASDVEEVPAITSGIPRIVTVAPQSAYVGEDFSYTVKVADSDTELEDITLELIEAPAWLRIRDRFDLYGKPVIVGGNTQKVVVEVTDGKHITTQTFYLLILAENETED